MTATATSREPSGGVSGAGSTAVADHAVLAGLVVVANGVALVGLWLRHLELHSLQGPGGVWTAVGQATGLAAGYVILLELVLMSRLPWVERHVGLDRLAVWHRWTGFAAVDLVLVHVVGITIGYAEAGRLSIFGQTFDFVDHFPDVLMSFAGAALFLAIGVLSMRASRLRVRRETWYFVHLYAYLAVALAFAHQLAVGTDFTTDAVARVWWTALYASVGALLIAWRVAWPIWLNARHRFRIDAVVPEARGVVSFHVSGRDVAALDARAGQFFLLRVLTRDGWWRAHPFSLSASAAGGVLRFTVKDLGDHTHWMQGVRPGTPIFLEGPFGTFTDGRRARRRVALIAGGIGVTPLRALLEELSVSPADIAMLYRCEDQRDLVFLDELRWFVDRGAQIWTLVGREIGDDTTDQLGIPALRRLVPDLADRDVFVCGPPAMIAAVSRRARRIGVPRARIHTERFDY